MFCTLSDIISKIIDNLDILRKVEFGKLHVKSNIWHLSQQTCLSVVEVSGRCRIISLSPV